MFANSSGFTALHVAAGMSAECVKILATVTHLNWNIASYFGKRTPLYIALSEGNAGAVETIIAQEQCCLEDSLKIYVDVEGST